MSPPFASTPSNPICLLALEIVTPEGRDFLLSYLWMNNDERGVFLAPLAWERDEPSEGNPRHDG